jgi:ABC-type dipeptide/oligopeptide/nickel transport system permease component
MGFLITHRWRFVDLGFYVLRKCAVFVMATACVFVGLQQVRMWGVWNVPEDVWMHGQNTSGQASYGAWLWGFMTGDWGVSGVDGRPVWEVLKKPLWQSCVFALGCESVAALCAYACVVLGSVARWGAYVKRVCVVGCMVPTDVLAFALLGVWMHTGLAVTGVSVLAVCCGAFPRFVRWTWLLMCEAEQGLATPYMRVVWGKGLRRWHVGWVHVGAVVRPFWKQWVLADTAGVLASLVVLEVVFGIRGVGYVLWESLARADHAVVLGVVGLLCMVNVWVAW